MRIHSLSYMRKVRHRHGHRYIELAQVLFYVALLPSPFLSHHRRSRTQSNNFPFSTCSPVSPQERGTSMRRTLGVLNTPPPKLTNNSQPKYKGSFTDPPHRRRPSFGQVCYSLPAYFTVNSTRLLCISRCRHTFLMKMHLNLIHNPFQLPHNLWCCRILFVVPYYRLSANRSHNGSLSQPLR